jgi:glycosyltransferase involved in cell wall biosynthesis
VFYNPTTARELAAEIKRIRPDAILLHNLYPVGSPSVYHTAFKAGIPVIQYIHNFRPFSVSGTLWANGAICEESLQGNYWKEVRHAAWQNSVIKSAVLATALKFLHATGWLDAVKGWVAISNFMRDRFVEAGIPPSKIHVLGHFWDFRTGHDEYFPDKGHYLYLGRLVSEKGIAALLSAWQHVCDASTSEPPELWIGGAGPMSEVVEKAAAKCAKIKFLGFVSDNEKEEAIRNCRAMIAPSTWWEPLGLVTYEAYDYKKPMFAAASGGLTETVEHAVTGFLHEPGNSAELANQVLACEKLSAEDRKTMGMAGRDWLECHADSDDWQQTFDVTIKRILEQ